MTHKNRIPPQALDFEESVLGAILMERDVLYNVINIIDPECFYQEHHQIIFKAILDMDRENIPIDLLTVSEYLKNAKKLQEIGGPAYLAKLIGKVATADHITKHAEYVREKYLQRELIALANNILKTAYDDSQDVKYLISQASFEFDRIIEKATDSRDSYYFRDHLSQALKEFDERERLSKTNECIGIPSPLLELNRITNGFQPGELIVIAGRPSMGKTSLALSIAKTAAKENKHTAFFTLEMPGPRIAEKVLLSETDLDPDRTGAGKFSKIDRGEIEKFQAETQDFVFFIFDKSTINVDHIRAKCKMLKKKDQCDLVIIDYLQLINEKQSSNQNREQVVADISRRLKNLAADLNVPIILLSQLNRNCELRSDKRPLLADLRESGAIEQDADVVMLVYRPAFYGMSQDADGNDWKGTGELSIVKNRNGRTKTIRFKHNESMTKIFDMPLPGEIEPVDNRDVKTLQFPDN